MDWLVKQKLHPIIWMLIGVLLFSVFRFTTYSSDDVHYHANFNIVIDGEEYMFTEFTDYVEIAACEADHEHSAEDDGHLHDHIGDVAHIHTKNLTWGQFFQNIRVTFSNQHLQVKKDVYTNERGNEVSFILNGNKVTNPSTTIIESEDRLLINYGDQNDNQLQKLFRQVPKTAHEHNQSADPAACGGSEPSSFEKRLRNIFF